MQVDSEIRYSIRRANWDSHPETRMIEKLVTAAAFMFVALIVVLPASNAAFDSARGHISSIFSSDAAR